jgi:SAM-dependent methyltransferase
VSWGEIDGADDVDRFVEALDRVNADPFFRRLKERIRALVVGPRVVEVGCGAGEDAAACGALGVDLSWTMLATARTRVPSLPLAQARAHRLPFSSSSIDGVFADRVLQHLVDAGDALKEWARVLRRGGRVVVSDPDLTTAALAGVDSDGADDVLTWRAGTRPGVAAVASLADSLRGAGFEDVAVERHQLVLRDLSRADRAMGLETWGTSAWGDERGEAWREAIQAAAVAGTLRYSCDYVIGSGAAKG